MIPLRITWGEDGASLYAEFDGVERKIAGIPLPHWIEDREMARDFRRMLAISLCARFTPMAETCGHDFAEKARALALGDCPVCLRAELTGQISALDGCRLRAGILTPIPECGGIYCEGIYGPDGLHGYKCDPDSGPTCKHWRGA